MTLQVITGPANAGKTGIAYTRVRSCASAGGSAVVLLPAEPDVVRVSREFARDSPVGVRVATVDGFIDGLWRTVGDGRGLLSAARRGLLVAQTVRICQSEIPHAVWDTPGSLVLLERLVMRAAESGTEGVRLPDLGRSTSPAVDEVLLHALSVYQEQARASGVVERAEAHQLIVGSLESVPLPDVIVVNGVTGLTVAQEAFVVAAAQRTEVIVCLTYDETVPATHGSRDLVERLGAHGRVWAAPGAATYTAEPELLVLERSLGGLVRGEPLVAAGAIRISEAWGDEAEAARIAREVQEAISAGIEPGRIAIVFRDATHYISPLRAALAEISVPAEWDVYAGFGVSGLGRALQVAVRFDTATAAERMDLLRSPYSPGDGSALDALDSRVRRSGDVAPGRFVRWCDEADPLLGVFVGAVRKACTSRGEGAVQEWASVVSGMLGRAWPEAVHAEMPLMLDAGAARVFMGVLAGALDSARDPLKDMHRALKRARIAITSTGDPGCVQVMSAERARGRRFECVIVGGLNDGDFPRSAAADPLRAQKIADALRDAGVHIASGRDLELERLLFYQVATRASKRLVLSWQSHDADGKPKRPSIFLEEVRDLYRGSEELKAEALGQSHAGGAGPVPAVLGPDWFTRHPAGPVAARRELRAAVTRSAEEGGGACWDGERIADARRRARRPACELSESARRFASERVVFTVSEIEAYLRCPLEWFVSFVLRPRPLDVRLDAAAIGRVGHRALYRFYTEYPRRTGYARVSPESLPEAQMLYGSIAESVRDETRTTRPSEGLRIGRILAAGARVIEADADFLPGFVPAHVEWEFGTAEGDEPEPLGDFALAGRIDRVDIAAQDLVVTDYKSGTLGAGWGHGAFEREGRVQLPLYARVAGRRLGREVAGGLYRPIGSGRPRGFVRSDLSGPTFLRTDRVDGSSIQLLIDDAVRRAAGAVDGMRSGVIEPNDRKDCPEYCPARNVCPKKVSR